MYADLLEAFCVSSGNVIVDYRWTTMEDKSHLLASDHACTIASLWRRLSVHMSLLANNLLEMLRYTSLPLLRLPETCRYNSVVLHNLWEMCMYQSL